MDDIQQKLALIDAQRAGRGWGHRLPSTAPLFLPAIGLMAGILVQRLLSRNGPDLRPIALVWIWVALLVLCAAGGLFVAVRQQYRTFAQAPATFCFLCLGAIRLLAFETPASNDVRHLVGTEPRLATIRGRILTEPQLQKQDWCFAQFAYADPSTSFYLKAESIKTPAGWHDVAGTVRARVEEPALNLKAGQRIQAYCWLHRFEGPTNPGQFDFPAYLARLGVHVGASIPSRDAVKVQGEGSPDLLSALRRRFTGAAAQGLLQDTPADTHEQAMLAALLLGDRRDIDAETYEAFRKTGLAHIISLSGMNLAVLIAVIWWFCKLPGLPKWARAVVCIMATGAFLLAVPPTAPIFRATVMVWVYCMAILFRRHASNPLNSLSLAAIILLLIRPTQLFEAGWQLSFSAVAGIVAFTPRIELVVHDLTGDWFREASRPSSRWLRLLRGFARRTILLFSAGTAAWLSHAGILLYHFYTVTPLASLWTALASGPVAVIVTLGFLKIILSGVLPTAGTLLGLLLPWIVDVFIWIVRLSARMDFSSTLIGHVPFVLILLYYGLVLFAAFVHLRRPIVKKAVCAAVAVVLLGSLGAIKWQRTHRGHLAITCLDVGHGQAVLVQLPGTMNVLFDAGSTTMSDIGARVVSPCLDYMGISRLHAVVLSHHDLDHINGVPEVVDCRKVDRVCAHDAFLDRSQGAPTAALLLQHLQAKRIEVDRLPPTLRAGEAGVQVIWPAGESDTRQELSENDSSLVCLIEFADSRVLLCSDIEQFAQQQVLRLRPALKADVIVAPHHGSTRTLDREFLPHVAPRVLVCSCSRQDWQRGLAVAPGDHAQSLVTARDGAIRVCISKHGVVKATAYRFHEGVQNNE